MNLRHLLVAAILIVFADIACAQTTNAEVSPEGKKANGQKTMPIYDEKEIRVLYKEAKVQNEKLADGLPGHLNVDDMELFEFKPLLVEGRLIELPTDLNRKLDPDDLGALWRRLDKIDPAEANLVRWDARTNAEFMLGTYDMGGALGRHEGKRSEGITQNQLLRLLGLGKKQLEKETDELQR